jgi:hypothetical protein
MRYLNSSEFGREMSIIFFQPSLVELDKACGVRHLPTILAAPRGLGVVGGQDAFYLRPDETGVRFNTGRHYL